MSPRRDFTAATWNVYHGTPVAKLEPILQRLLTRDVSLLLMQEVAHEAQREMLWAAGLEVFFHPRQYVVAWHPAQWVEIESHGVRLSETAYWRPDGGDRQYSEAALAILCDRAGRSLTAMSYHTPAHVQHADKPPNRITALVESAAMWREVSTAAQTRACLFGGDDNVDEDGRHGPWGFMQARATGLRQIQAPSATHGRTRRIDDFRVRGLRAGPGYVLPGGGDHRIHVRDFVWR